MDRLFHTKQILKDKALQLGFTHFGIAAAQPVPNFKAFKRWVNAGFHADMHYLAREDALAKRAAPELILKNSQRVICLAMPYNPPQTSLDKTTPGFGRISAYARSRDYHLVITERLTQLEEYLLGHTENTVAIKSFVDTGPILERSFATKAGLGMHGKNSNLIIPQTGSYCFLAVMLTDLALPVDAPFTRDLCGSCQRCIEACPTGCILPDRTIDASRCISYLTIEHKSTIPDVLKSQIGNWLLGCDICQMVCPHNARISTPDGPLGKPCLPEEMELVDILAWDEDDFRAITQNTALTRPKLRGLVRNAVIILGNQAQVSALPLLKTRLMKETDSTILEALHWAIKEIEINKPDDADKND